MALVVETVDIDLSYQVFFTEPQLELSKENNRLKLVGNVLRTFGLRLNDLKYNQETPSNNSIHFSKFFGRAFFDVSLGYEECTAKLRNPIDKNQALEIYGGFAQIIESIPISHQNIFIQQHLSTNGDATDHLSSLNPICPENFATFLQQSGVHYTLKIPDHELTIHVTLVGSLFVQGGLYLNENLHFIPNRYDFKKTYELSTEYHEFILKELGLKMKENL